MYVLYDEMVISVHPTGLLHYLSLISYIHSNAVYKQDNILSFFCSGSETLESVPFIFFIEEYENSSQERENVLSPVIDEWGNSNFCHI